MYTTSKYKHNATTECIYLKKIWLERSTKHAFPPKMEFKRKSSIILHIQLAYEILCGWFIKHPS